MSLDPTIRPANVAVLFKLQTAEDTRATPDPAADAIPIEADSLGYNSPWTSEQSNEATGSLVSGAPLIVGQPATITFKSRIKGAGAGVNYTASVKPPLHAPLAASGWKPQFTAAVSAAAIAAATSSSVTLGTGFATTADAYLGMMLSVASGPGAGALLSVMDYSTGKVAALGEDAVALGLTTSSQVALPANWTYAQTSPSDAATRATDQPVGECWIYEDGRLLKFYNCRGVVAPDGQNARPGYGTFSMKGVYGGATDAAIPSGLVIAGHSAPILVQASSLSGAALVNRKGFAISTWSLDPGSDTDSPADPNSTYGFGSAIIGSRTPMLKMDPLMTLIANRDTIADIGLGNTSQIVLRHGTVAGNRWALSAPLAQPVMADPGTRGQLRSEDISWQLRTSGKDAFGRDTDRILCFY